MKMFSGILLINKPSGLTSFQVINRIKKHFVIKKIGHAGTLDSFATGLLIVGVNEATKLLSLYMEREKVYEALIRLGETSDTLDVTGNIVPIPGALLPETDDIKKVLKGFIGTIMQVPPQFSAIKIKGKRASDIIRNGGSITIEPRQIRIKDIEILDYTKPDLKLLIRCSKGTYIRALARDMGEAFGCGGYVRSLTRLEISPFKLSDALSMESMFKEGSIEKFLIPLKDSLPFIEKVMVSSEEKEALQKGGTIKRHQEFESDKLVAVTETDVVALLEVVPGKSYSLLKPLRVLK